MTQENLFNRALPKWSQLFVTGKSVTVEQAKEIIFRTDSFLTETYEHAGGNCREFNEEYRRLAGLDRYRDSHQHGWALKKEVCKRIGFVETSYVTNDWASCCFIWGGHGWCSPQGGIHYVDNVGKWPSVCEVYEDWKVIAHAFPFLELTATLMDGEDVDRNTRPVVNIVVKEGGAELQEGDLNAHNSVAPRRRDWDGLPATFLNVREELALPNDWYEEFASRVRAVVDSISDADLAESV
jgi:hypothetical protein